MGLITHIKSCIAAFCVLASLMTAACAFAADEVPSSMAGKITPETWSRVKSGEISDLIVEFDDTAVETEARNDLARRGRKIEDDAALARKVANLRKLKQPIAARLQKHEAEIKRDYSHLPLSLMHFSGAASVEKLLSGSGVAAVYEDRKLYANLTESLPLIGQPAVANVMNRKGAGASVAVLDTGLSYTRSEFGACTAPGVPSGCLVKAEYYAGSVTNTGNLDAIGHGTRVAATVAGVAPLANLLAVHVFNGSSASSSDVIDGINWAIVNRTAYNIKAINMSLGDGINHTSACTTGNDPFASPISNARNAGIVVVVASGNEAYTTGISSPACVAKSLAVGAVYDAAFSSVAWTACTDSNVTADTVTCFSNSSSTLLDMLAPGAIITAAGASVGGTSFAAPFVAGAVAVLGAAFPTETPAQLEARLTGSGKSVTDSRNGVVKPRLNLLATQGAPTNDNFAAATAASGDSGSESGWNQNATRETGEPAHAGSTGSASVWWKWTATASGDVGIDTHGSGFDTLLGVYTGTAVNSLTTIASNNDDGSGNGASGLSFRAVSGTTYYFAVDGKNTASGRVTLNHSFDADTADLSVSIGATPDPVAVGSPLTYSLLVNNLGLSAASNLVVTHTLSGGVTVFSVDAACTQGSGVVTCNVASLAPGGSIGFSVVVVPSAAGTLVGQLTASSATVDGNAANNTATVSTTVNPVVIVDDGNEGDAPMPPWALAMLGLGLFGAMRQRLMRR